MEPVEYFNALKDEINIADSDELQNILKTIESELIRANQIGQTTIVERLIFARKSIAREIEASLNGINRYVYKSAISKFIDNVLPANSVKIIELKRYHRIIPEKNMREIKRIQELNIFDDFCVVFTDLTNENVETPEEEAFKIRNRDPIVFGYHRKERTSLRSDRFYLITDWEDEYCDLTFDRLVENMAKDQHGTVDVTDPIELNRIIEEVEANESVPTPQLVWPDDEAANIPKKSLINRLKFWW